MDDASMTRHTHAQTLAAQDRELLKMAEENQQKAYAPYSGFRVGAAILTEKGSVISGANQENASYPLCMCGERVALYNCAMHHPEEVISVLAIAVKGQSPLASPAPPCGACLQVIVEFEQRQTGRPIRLLLKADGEEVWEFPSVKYLLPYAFDGSFLKS